MTVPSLRLLVMYTSRLPEVLAFYERLGLEFVPEQHGKGPVHYSANLNEFVLELYPAQAANPECKLVRLGFSVENLDNVVRLLDTTETLSEPTRSSRGHRAIVKDPDGRVVELYARSE
ncbi:MAG: VOC family protein [Gemmataceae bacterium]